LRPSFVLSVAAWVAAQSRRPPARWSTAMRATCVALLQGPSLQSGFCCPGPSSLNRPHPPHSRAPHDFAARRLIRGAFAVRERLGDPRAVPVFRCPFLSGMPSPKTPGSSDIHKFQSRDVDIGLRRCASGSALPKLPQIRFTRAADFEASTVRVFTTACQIARPPARI